MNAATQEEFGRREGGWRLRLYAVIFESDTRAGRLFDRWLIVAILLSVAVVVADSVHALGSRSALEFDVLEWAFTLLFTVEYLARLACVRKPLRYAPRASSGSWTGFRS